MTHQDSLAVFPRRRLDWRVLSVSSGSFLALTYVLCIVWGLLWPDVGSHRLLADLLPGFTWLTWGSFFIGLVESFVYGVYAGALFASLYNSFSRLISRGRAGERL